MSFSYLALGDSYTIGEGVALEDSFPFKFKKIISNYSPGGVGNLKVIATTGWTTADLLGAIQVSSIENKYDFVTLLIGVNNQYQNKNLDLFEVEFRELFLFAKSKVRFLNQLFVLSIPDWGVTPFANEKKANKSKVASEIDNYNQVIKKICSEHFIQYIDVTEISRLAVNNDSLLAADGLNPSSKMYEMWVCEMSKHLGKCHESGK